MELAATLAARDAQLAVPVAAGAAGGAPTQTDLERVNAELRVERDDLLRRVAALDESLEQALVSKAHLKMYRSCCICCCGFIILALVSWAVMGMMGLHLLCPSIHTLWVMSECNQTLGAALGLAQDKVPHG